MVLGVIGGLAFISTAYCFWLMTIPLSYDLVYVVVGGFIVSIVVLVIVSISLLVIAVRRRRVSRPPTDRPIV